MEKTIQNKSPKEGLGKEIVGLIKANIRDYMMYIALVVIMLFFTWRTGGSFIQARNLSNLINQAGYVAVLAIGMTLILILKHIDLSVGYVAGFCGAVAAILMTQAKVNAGDNCSGISGGLADWSVSGLIGYQSGSTGLCYHIGGNVYVQRSSELNPAKNGNHYRA